MPDQKQNTAQTQDAGADDFAAWEAQRNAELTGESADAEEPATESSDESETPEEKKESEGQDSSEDEESEEGKGEDGEKQEEKPKRKGGFERKIGKLTRQKSELERQNRELAEKLAALEKPKAEDKPAKSDDQKPRSEDFESFDEFTEALTDWKLDQRAKAQEAKDAEAKAKAETESRKQKAAEGWNDRVAEARKQFADYDEVLEEAADIDVPAELESALLEAGPAVLYHLAKDPAEAERISKLPVQTALREIGKIEAKIASQPAAKEEEPEPTPKPKPKPSQAPRPAKPLGGSSGALIDDDDLPFDQWEKRRNKHLRG